MQLKILHLFYKTKCGTDDIVIWYTITLTSIDIEIFHLVWYDAINDEKVPVITNIYWCPVLTLTTQAWVTE